ncbi:TetR/AcrR family transcriptional regulator [Pseudoclavibacter helvolus]|uniref:TetR/AcrR family transcriptional regulator n=1 Tax=Pseudoclavibacter helvolus TaxID=255205 RepID=UPI003C782340
MSELPRLDTRERLLDAAADLIAAAPGEDFSLRAVCDAVGVKMPTLYHFFGSKNGLIEAVIDRGFDLYMRQKNAQPENDDPIQEIRTGWDTHVEFGLDNPGFYTLMYGKVRPGHSPAAQSGPSLKLLSLAQRAAEQGRLVVEPEQAAAHILVTNIGVTLRQIVLAQPDQALSNNVREGAIAAITGTSASPSPGPEQTITHQALEMAAATPGTLSANETRLLAEWLQKLASATTAKR